MVKITDPLKDLELELTIEEKLIKHDEIEKKQIKNINLLATAEEKKVNQTVRLPESLLNTVKVYSKIHDISINSIIENYLVEKFDNKKITRDMYNIPEVTILVPTNLNLLHKYIKNNVNIIANFDESAEETLSNVNLFDKQANLYNANPEDFQVMKLHTSNNYLDVYNKKHECYYNEMFFDEVSTMGLDLELFVMSNTIFKNHVGLVALTHHKVKHNTNKYNTTDIKEDKIDTETAEGLQITVFLLIHEFDNTIRNIQIITPKRALELAAEVENNDIKNYIENNVTVAELSAVEVEYKKEAELIERINTLMKINDSYQKELHNVKVELAETKEEYEGFKEFVRNLDKKNELAMKYGLIPEEESATKKSSVKLDKDTAEEISKKLADSKEVLEMYYKLFNQNLNKYEDTINELDNYLKSVEDVKASEDVEDVNDTE